jgi:DNA invertase Pin-like site-specific DNA recombinase
MGMASSPRPDEDIRNKLDRLGKERAALNERDIELSDEIRETLAAAEGIVPKAECARRLGLHRTTLYRVYPRRG